MKTQNRVISLLLAACMMLSLEKRLPNPKGRERKTTRI